MEIVIEDPSSEDGTTTYKPLAYRYEEKRRFYSLILERDGLEIERTVPAERVVYVETEA